jgi:hypothetical protein
MVGCRKRGEKTALASKEVEETTQSLSYSWVQLTRRRVVLHQCSFAWWVLAHCQDKQTLYSRWPRKGTEVFTYLSSTTSFMVFSITYLIVPLIPLWSLYLGHTWHLVASRKPHDGSCETIILNTPICYVQISCFELHKVPILYNSVMLTINKHEIFKPMGNIV